MFSVRLFWSLIVAACGAALCAWAIADLDPPLWVKHETARGWIGNAYFQPSRSAGRREMTMSYGFNDGQGRTYQRSTYGIGYERPGDSFTVIYDPVDPRRHRAVTLWGLFLPGLALLSGGGMLAWGGSRVLEAAPRWQRAFDHALRRRREKRLDPAVARAARGLVASMSRSAPFIHLDWYHANGPGERDLSVWFVFDTNAELEHAFASGLSHRIDEAFRDVLRSYGYPPNAIPGVFVGFRSRAHMEPPPVPVPSPKKLVG